MKQVYDPNQLVGKYEQYSESYVKPVKDGEFQVGRCYDDEPAETLYCKHCGGSDFKVAQGSYFTAIKCKKCEYEVGIHEG
jgi:hypothetical protein